LSKSWQVWAEWGFLLAGLAGVVLASPGEAWVLLGGLALVISFCLRAWRTGRVLPSSGLELPWVLFLASAAFAAWLSIFPDSAFLQLIRLAAGFVLYCAVVEASPQIARLAGWGLVAGAGLLALYWPLTHNFESDPAKLPLFNTLGRAISVGLPRLPGADLSPNVTGGGLALAVPFGVALAWIAWRRAKRGEALLAGGLTLLVLGALLLTSSRGALLGLAVAGGLALLAWMQIRWLPGRGGKLAFWSVTLLAGLVLLTGVAASGNLERLVGSVPDPTGSLQSRVQIWRQGVTLIGDYVFTGAGLGSFPLVFSIYRLLIHVPYHEHMHNIVLEVWYEQGVLGVIAMLWAALVVLRWAWSGLSPAEDASDEALARRALGWAGMAALAAMSVHGMVDVVFYLKRTAPLLGLVAGFASFVELSRAEVPVVSRKVKLAVAGGAVVALLLAAWGYRPVRFAWYANLGALAQMQVELGRYDPERFDAPSLDQIRREADLSQAEAMFGRALANDPGNRTALQRMAQIELSRGAYPAALGRMEAARQAGLQDEVTRLLTGDALVAGGDPLRAVQEVSNIPWAGGRLAFQGWYRYWLGEDYPRAADAWQAVVLLNPQDEEAKARLNEARDRMGVWPLKAGPGVLDCSDIVKAHKESTNEQWEKTQILLRGSEMYYNGTVNAVTETDAVHMTGSLCHPTLHHVPHEIALNLSNGQQIEGIGIIQNITFTRGEDIDLDVIPDLLFVRESP